MNRTVQRYAKLTSLLLLGLFFFVGLDLPALAQLENDATILAVDVVGNEKIPTETVLKAITHIRLGEKWDKEKINEDLRAVQELGYFSIVDASSEAFLGGLKLVIRVKENPTFKEFKFLGLTQTEPNYLSTLFTQKKGEIINLTKMREDLGKAIRTCQDEKGYILVFRDSEIGADGTLTLTLSEVKLRKITVTGLTRTKEIVIRRELTLKEGEVLNVLDLKEDYQTLARLQLFEGINPVIQNTEIPDWVDIVLEIREREQVGQLNFGLGYSPSSGDVKGQASIAHPNLWGMARSGSLNFELGEEENNFFLEYADPWFMGKHLLMRTRLFYDNQEERYFFYKDDEGSHKDYYDQTRYGLDFTFGKPIKRNLYFNTTLTVQQITNKNNVDGVNQSGFDDYDEYWHNGVTFSLIEDERTFKKDRAMVVTGGHKDSLSVSYFLGDHSYTSYVAESARYYTPWDSGPTFAFRLKGGYMQGGNDIHPSDKFELGGATTLRGYDDTEFIGEKLLLFNAEARYYLKNYENIELVAFVDYGSTDWEEFGSSYGVGIRYNLPMLGQIRIDYGWNGEGDSPEFHFFIGEMF